MKNWLIFLIFILYPFLFAYAGAKDQHKILYINSYHFGYSWSDNEMNGFKKSLEPFTNDVEIYYEFMDTKRSHTRTHISNIYKLFLEKYSKYHFDVIAAADNDAYDFILKYRNTLFADVPVVFLGINDFNSDSIAGQKNITGVIENTDYLDTIETAIRLLPKTKKLVVISDGTVTGLAHSQAVDRLIPLFTNRIQVESLSFESNSIKEILAKINALKDGSVILLLAHFMDKEGRYFSQDTSLQLITSSANVPVFVITDSRLGNKVIGGKVVSSFYQGFYAGNMVKSILNGTPADEIPILEKSPNKYMFDYQVLKKFRIHSSLLPKDTILINKSSTFLKKYLFFFLGIFIFIFALISIIVILLINITQRKKAEVELRESEEKFSKAFRTSPDAVNINRMKDGYFLAINEGFTALTGYTEKDVMGKSSLDINLWNNSETRLRLIEELKENGKAIIDAEFRLKDGRTRLGQMTAAVITINNEPCIISITRDITEKKMAELEIQKSLEEKETLLREIHHRVKNNLQVISSLLSLQEKYIHDKEMLAIFKESQNRVKSMAMIHERLYQSKDLLNVDFRNYLESLTNNLIHSYGIDYQKITVEIKINLVSLRVDTAIPCGFIINELVSNSFKHAFPNGREGKVLINLYQENETCVLIVRDNGVGLPDNFSFENTESLGLQLVSSWIKQLNGSLMIQSHREEDMFTEFKIEFPLT